MEAVNAAVVPSCLRESGRAETHRHGLSATLQHICQAARSGRSPPAPDVGDRSTDLPRRQGAGLPRMREAVCPQQLHRSPAAGLSVHPAAVHGADR